MIAQNSSRILEKGGNHEGEYEKSNAEIALKVSKRS